MTRRRFITAGTAAAAAPLLAGCDLQLSDAPQFRWFLDLGQAASLRVQRLLLAGQPLVREYTMADISPDFPPNGTAMPPSPLYRQMMMRGFENWQLTVDGLVRKPLSLTLEDIRAMPGRTQITMHNCDEGWSAIGQWTGVQLGLLLKAAGVAPGAKYAVFHCADNLLGEPAKGGLQAPGQYYESIGLIDAHHPQTLIAYAMNGRPLDVAHGAPLRLRIERQLGYKQAKYVQRIELTDSLAGIAGGRGGFWEDRGYEWYAGI
jgi:DMSO/TMAO reductase YedYZ molybdopterin-dependent catalytic subunit